MKKGAGSSDSMENEHVGIMKNSNDDQLHRYSGTPYGSTL